MRIKKTAAVFLGMVAVLLCLFCTSPVSVRAQALGDNAVYGPSSTTTNSKAFIDASAFTTSAGGPAGANDLCSVLSYIYSSSNTVNPIPSTGAVIDARGIATGSSNACANINPWPTSGTVPPTTVLLPAGGIFISSTWQVPSGTHLIGQRRNTNINPSTSFTSGAFMIQMGPSSSCSCPASGCPPVVLEQLTIQDSGATVPYVSGIDNECSGPSSYVDHIVMFDVAGVGIKIGANAGGSGPYTDIDYTAGAYCQTNSPCPSSCVQIGASIRGVHGITCTLASHGLSGLTNAGILIDAPDNSIEDIHIEGFVDGVLVGDTAAAPGSSLLHITSGNGGNSSGPVQNTIRICNPANAKDLCKSTAPASSDVVISQVINNTNSGVLIQDDLTSTSVGIPPGSSVPYTAGLYVLGEPVGTGGGYSRFSTTTTTTSSQTTTQATPVWGVAALSSGTTPPTPCPAGAIFSNTSGSGSTTASNTIYVCELSSGTPVWNVVTNN